MNNHRPSARSVEEDNGLVAPAALPAVIAHRGCGKRAPENTLRALRLAVACGIEMIEIDVRGTKDDVPVLLHDATLERTTTGWGQLRDWTFNELRRQVDNHASQTGRVPSLAEALEVTDGKATLAIEIKDIGITEAVVDEVLRVNAGDRVEIWSFDDEALTAARSLAPVLRRVHLYRPSAESGVDPKVAIGHAWERGAHGVAFQPADATPEAIELAHDLGLTLVAGTVEDARRALDLAMLGVDGLTSDDPLTIKQAFDEMALTTATPQGQEGSK